MAPTAQPTQDQGSQPLTESNVNSEVDRILKEINVNDFLKDTVPSRPPLSSDTSSTQKIPEATSILASFIASATPNLLTSALREKLQEVILDYIAVVAAGSTIAPSTEPILNGILAFAGLSATSHLAKPSTSNGTSNGNGISRSGCTVITKGQTYPPHYAGLLNATFGHSLDFDDTHVTSTLHAGVTAISAALACAESMVLHDANSHTICADNILLAIALAYETTIRIGMGLSTASYARGFHNTGVAGIFGAIAAISSLRKLSASAIINAFGLAGSKAAGTMQYLSNGSWNKRLNPGFAVHDAFLCVSLAEAGVLGADKIIEGELGIFQAYTERDRSDIDWSRFISSLGSRWEFADSALKPYAGCRMTHGFIELSDILGHEIRKGDFGAKKVRKITCHMPKANMILIGQRTTNKVHPLNMVDAQFSCYFQVANALCYGGTHDMAAYDRLEDPLIAVMAQRVECRVDDSMGGFSARMDILLEDDDGSEKETVSRKLDEPLGEVSHPFVKEKVQEKFIALMTPVYGDETSRKVMERVYALGGADQHSATQVMDLLDLLTIA